MPGACARNLQHQRDLTPNSQHTIVYSTFAGWKIQEETICVMVSMKLPQGYMPPSSHFAGAGKLCLETGAYPSFSTGGLDDFSLSWCINLYTFFPIRPLSMA